MAGAQCHAKPNASSIDLRGKAKAVTPAAKTDLALVLYAR
jgi:hypothetical protein